MEINAAIAGIGASEFGLNLPQSQMRLGATAFKAALADSGLAREDVDGLSIHQGAPLGADYDRVAGALGLNLRYVNQSWLHGRFVTGSLQHAAMAVTCGMADVVACFTAVSFSRERHILTGDGDDEAWREEGGSHGEAPLYGHDSPGSGAALAMRRYMEIYGVTTLDLAEVPVSIRAHASRNPAAIMQKPLSVEAHQSSRLVIDPLRLYDFCLLSDAAVVVLVTTRERARDLRQTPVRIASMQGLRAGREEFVFGPQGLGLAQQCFAPYEPAPLQPVFAQLGMTHRDVDAFYTYDAFSPLVLFSLERFGYCGRGEAGHFIKDGRIGPGGELPVNTSGGLLSEAHVSGWNSIAEMTRQIRGAAGSRQLPRADVLHWGTPWGDAVILTPD